MKGLVNMKKSNKGFTLVELIIVIAVIGVLAAILIPVFSNVIDKANQKSALSDARNAVAQFTAKLTDEEGLSMPESLVFVKKANKLWAVSYTNDGGCQVLADNGFKMLSNGATESENFANTVAAYEQQLKAEGYVSNATLARKAYCVNSVQRDVAQYDDATVQSVERNMMQQITVAPDTMALSFSYTPTQNFFQNTEAAVPSMDAGFSINGVASNAATLQDAINAAPAGATIRLYEDTTASAVIEVTNNITIDGNGHTITANGTRGLWIDSSNVTLNMKNVTLDCTNKERGVQINSNLSNVTINMSNVTIKNVTHYAVNVCAGCTNLAINIDNANIKSWAALNIWSDADVHVTNSVLHGYNNKSYNAQGWNNFSTINVEGDTTGHTDMHAESVDILVEDSIIIAEQTTGNRQKLVGFNSQSKNNIVTLKNCDLRSNDADVDPDHDAWIVYNYGETNTFVNENYSFTDLTTNQSYFADSVTVKDLGSTIWYNV